MERGLVFAALTVATGLAAVAGVYVLLAWVYYSYGKPALLSCGAAAIALTVLLVKNLLA